MKKLILLTLTAITLIACADNGVSAPNQICYDKKYSFNDVSTTYTEYEAEWYEKACVAKSTNTYECIYWDPDYILTVRECLENVDNH